MNKIKRIAAMIGIILLGALYLLTFISSLFANNFTNGLFLASLFSTFFIPVSIYAFMLIYRLVHKTNDIFSPNTKIKKKEEDQDKE